MNFYNTLQSKPMILAADPDLETLIACANGSYQGYRPHYVTPCIQRNESLTRITAHMDCQSLHYTGLVMVEVWSYNPEMLRAVLKMVRSQAFQWVAAAIPQPQRRSVFLLVQADIESHEQYVETHRALCARLRQLMPPMLHTRPNLANETDFLQLHLDRKCFYRHDSTSFMLPQE